MTHQLRHDGIPVHCMGGKTFNLSYMLPVVPDMLEGARKIVRHQTLDRIGSSDNTLKCLIVLHNNKFRGILSASGFFNLLFHFSRVTQYHWESHQKGMKSQQQLPPLEQLLVTD